jgi:hypothetical protein
MEKSNKPEKKPLSPKQDRSFVVSLERLAGLLRAEIKLKDKKTTVLPPSPLAGSLSNTVMRVAKLLHTQIKTSRPLKERSWKTTPNNKEL